MEPRAALIAILSLCFAATAGNAVAQAQGADGAATEAEEAGLFSRFIDPLDGKLDVTAGSEGGGTSGMVPIAVPGNEPTLGPSLLAAIVYFHEIDATDPAPAGTPPSMTFGGVGATENDSWGAAGGHYAVRNGGRLRYLGLVGAASVNLGFYGLAESSPLQSNPIDFNFEGALLVQQAEFRIGASNFFAGGRYVFLAADIGFQELSIEDLAPGRTRDAGLAAFINYDTRDNTFTPERGTNASIALSVQSDSLGGDFDYQKLDLKGLQYWQLFEDRLILGLRTEYRFASDDAPFYSLPWISLRGVPIFRYVGNYAFTAEIEPRYKLTDRWSVLAFAGIGRAASSLDRLDDSERAYNFGVGFRYMLARKLGLAGGVDLATGPEDTTLYLTFGSAWGL